MNRLFPTARLLSLVLALSAVSSTKAQLEITEIMYNTVAPNDNGWEWFEVRNTGGTEVDLLGAFLDRLGDPALAPGVSPNIGANSMNTAIPAGGVAVIYDGFVASGSPFNYDDQLFRDAWGLDANVPLIAADFLPALVNSGGGSIGVWADRDAYDMDLVLDDSNPENPVTRVGSFNNALVGIEFGHTSPWPSGSSSNGFSIEWSGKGSNSDGTEWSRSISDERGAVLSIPAIGQGELINNPEDYANPGDVFSSATGTPAAGLWITEIMYNPAWPNDTPWEWVEVYNNTGETIDFATTPYVFDDDDDASLSAANVTSGVIPDQGIAVLYNDDLTQEQVEAAWGDDINFIPVANFTGLANGGDLVALWPSLEDYENETQSTSSPRRTHDNAAAAVPFSNNDDGFPNDNGSSSIYVSSFSTSGSLTGDYNDDGVVDAADYTVWRDTDGSQQGYDDWVANFGATGGGATLTWALDIPPEGSSFSPNEVFGDVAIHPGGDVASPGTFVPVAVEGSVAAVPEPASVALLLIGATLMGFRRRP